MRETKRERERERERERAREKGERERKRKASRTRSVPSSLNKTIKIIRCIRKENTSGKTEPFQNN